MRLLDFLRSDNYITVPKSLAKEIGLNETVILMELVSIYAYHDTREELDNEGMFYCTIQKLEDNTSLKRKSQDTAIKNLHELNLIQTKQKGLPAKRYFLINEKAIYELILGNRANKDVPKGQTGNNNDEETYPQEKSRSNQVVPKEQTRTSERNKPVGPKGTSNNNDYKNDLKHNLSDHNIPIGQFPFYNWLEE